MLGILRSKNRTGASFVRPKLPSVLHDLADKFSVFDISPDLLGHRALGKVRVGRGEVDVDARRLAGEYFCVGRVLAQVNDGVVDLVEEEGRQGTQDLESEARALDDVDGADEGVDDDGRLFRVVNGDGICLAVDANVGVFAA